MKTYLLSIIPLLLLASSCTVLSRVDITVTTTLVSQGAPLVIQVFPESEVGSDGLPMYSSGAFPQTVLVSEESRETGRYSVVARDIPGCPKAARVLAWVDVDNSSELLGQDLPIIHSAENIARIRPDGNDLFVLSAPIDLSERCGDEGPQGTVSLDL